MTKSHVLDANALILFLEDRPGSRKVEQLVKESRSGKPLLMSLVSWGEVFYLMWRRQGEERARKIMAELSRFPIQLVEVDYEQAMKAAEIKAVHNVPYADALAAALAEVRDAVLVTSDRDFERLGRRIQVMWTSR